MIVVFDIGNVLVRWDRRNLFGKVFDDEARLERFLTGACAMDFVSHTDVVAGFLEGRGGARGSLSRVRRRAEALRLPVDRDARGPDRGECRAAQAPARGWPSGPRAQQFRDGEVRACAEAPSLPRRIRRLRRFGPCRRRQARSAHLRNPVRTGRTAARRIAVHRRLRSPTCAPPKRRGWRRSTIVPASISKASFSRSARCPDRSQDRAGRDEGAVEIDVVEHVRRERAEPVAVGRRAIAEMRVVRVAVVPVAGNRQEGDALLGNRNPAPFARQELEPPAALPIGGRGAVAAAAAELAVLAFHAGVDVVSACPRRTTHGRGRRREPPATEHSACQPLLLAADRSIGASMRSGRVPIALEKRLDSSLIPRPTYRRVAPVASTTTRSAVRPVAQLTKQDSMPIGVAAVSPLPAFGGNRQGPYARTTSSSARRGLG